LFYLKPPSPLCCQCHAISVLSCSIRIYIYSRFNCPFLLYRLCLSISHQCMPTGKLVVKNEISLSRQTSVYMDKFESYG